MPSQNYANHAHRPVPTTLAFFFVIFAIVEFVLYALGRGGDRSLGLGIGALTAAVVVLVAISRLYTTSLQNRIIRLEMRVRAASLLTPEQLRALHGLETPRLVALRFASDEELPALLDRAVRESLKPADIKRAIKNWVPDLHRT